MISSPKCVCPTIAALALLASATFTFAQARYSITDEDTMGPGSPRVVVLHDRVAGTEAAIAPSQGGELASFKDTRNGQMVELLYNARNYNPPPGTFHGRAPLLWPAVGAQYPVDTVPKASCGMGSYTVAGTSYPMPCHGFAKEMPWHEVSRSADAHGARVIVELTDSDVTRKYYPFAFHLDATFELANGAVTIEYTVNSGSSNTGPMPFSIGNHQRPSLSRANSISMASTDRKIMAYDLGAQGNASNGRIFLSNLDGAPDGLRVAANGNVYIATGPVVVYTPQGKLIRTIHLPELAANLEFGGPEHKTLFVTAPTSVYRVHVDDQGWTSH